MKSKHATSGRLGNKFGSKHKNEKIARNDNVWDGVFHENNRVILF